MAQRSLTQAVVGAAIGERRHALRDIAGATAAEDPAGAELSRTRPCTVFVRSGSIIGALGLTIMEWVSTVSRMTMGRVPHLSDRSGGPLGGVAFRHGPFVKKSVISAPGEAGAVQPVKDRWG
jgi:hypothetical protein